MKISKSGLFEGWPGRVMMGTHARGTHQNLQADCDAAMTVR